MEDREAESVQRGRREHDRQASCVERRDDPAQHGDTDAETHQCGCAEARDQSRCLPEQGNLHQHAGAPEQANGGAILARGLQVQGVEDIEGAEAALHQQRHQQESTHARPFPQVSGVGDNMLARLQRRARRQGAPVQPRGRHQCGEQRQAQPGEAALAQAIEQGAVARRHQQEADRAPDADPAIVVAARAERVQCHGLELRHDRVVEQAESRHHHEQLRRGTRDGESGEAGQRRQAAQHERQPGTRVARVGRIP